MSFFEKLRVGSILGKNRCFGGEFGGKMVFGDRKDCFGGVFSEEVSKYHQTRVFFTSSDPINYLNETHRVLG